MNFSSNDVKIITSIKNNSISNPLLLKKMLKSNKINKKKNKFNLSSKKTKFSKFSNFISNLDIDFDKNSLNNNIKNSVFVNEILVKTMKENNKKIILKDILKDNNYLKANKNYNTNYGKFNKNIKINNTNNLSHKKRINSARPLILDYNKRFNEIENIINLKNGNNNNLNIPKILAFKENIFVHEKNISLSNKNNNNLEIYDTFTNNIKFSNTDYNYNNKLEKYSKSKSKINRKFKRPKSAIYIKNNLKNNLIINNLELNNLSLKKQIKLSNNNNVIPISSDNIFNEKFNDLSYVNNSKEKEQTNEKQKKKSKQNKKYSMFASPFSYLCHSPSEKRLTKYNENNPYQHNKSNIDDIDILLEPKNKSLKKVNKGLMFRRRPIPSINEKYLIYLPKDLKKDIKNKYNFFSFLLTDNIYYNIGKKKKLYANKYLKKYKGSEINLEEKKNNRIKNNLTEFSYNYNINEKQDNFGTYKLNCRKEEEFMSYLKHLNYMEKHPDGNVSGNDKKIIRIKINKKNNIYKPVKIKADNSTSYDIEQRNEKKLYEKKIYSSQEDSELSEKIKSQPFINKRKSKLYL